MRGAGAPVSQLVTPEMNGYSKARADRPAYDPDVSRALLAEAGYPDGFGFGLKCPNDRYINDESACQAIVGMLSQIGISAGLEVMPVANYWPELREDKFDMYLLGWSPGGAFDAEHPIRFLAHTPMDNLGTWNFGGFSNARVDEPHPMIQSEIDRRSARRCWTRLPRSCRIRSLMCRCMCSRCSGGARQYRPDAATGQLL